MTSNAVKFLGVFMGNWPESSRKKFMAAIQEYRELEKNKLRLEIKGVK